MTTMGHTTETDEQITLETRSVDGARVVTVGGEVDMLTSPRLRAAMLTEIAAGATLVVLDLEGVTFLGTSGLAVLIELRDAARSADVPLSLVCTSRRVLRPLTIAGLVPLFDVHESVDTALAA
jgi:anti-sigma B factor antagonist